MYHTRTHIEIMQHIQTVCALTHQIVYKYHSHMVSGHMHIGGNLRGHACIHKDIHTNKQTCISLCRIETCPICLTDQLFHSRNCHSFRFGIYIHLYRISFGRSVYLGNDGLFSPSPSPSFFLHFPLSLFQDTSAVIRIA